MPGSGEGRQGTWGIAVPWAKGFPRYGSTTVLGIGSTFVQQGLEIVVLLGGGDKSTQSKDIKAVPELVKKL